MRAAPANISRAGACSSRPPRTCRSWRSCSGDRSWYWARSGFGAWRWRSPSTSPSSGCIPICSASARSAEPPTLAREPDDRLHQSVDDPDADDAHRREFGLPAPAAIGQHAATEQPDQESQTRHDAEDLLIAHDSSLDRAAPPVRRCASLVDREDDVVARFGVPFQGRDRLLAVGLLDVVVAALDATPGGHLQAE